MNFSLPGGPPSLDQAVERARRGVPSFPIRFWRVATASLPSASDEKSIGAMVWDTTDLIVKWSDGTNWVKPSLSGHTHTEADINLSATDVLVGRATSGAGAAEEIACTAAGRALLDDANASAQRTTLGLGTAAVKNTGTSGDAVPLLNTTADFSGRLSGSAGGWFGGFTASRPFDGIELRYVSGIGTVQSVTAAGAAMPTRVSGSDVRLHINGGDRLTIDGTAANFTVPIQRAGTQVVNTRITGWAAATGTATRTTFATSTVTLSELAERVKALIDDLRTHGLIGT